MAGKRMADSGYQYDVPADRSRVARVSGYKQRPLGPSDEDRLRWQRFLAELPERINQIRFEEAGALCPTCGSTTPKVVERKACVMCSRTLPLAAFDRYRAAADGRDSRCKECRSAANKRDAKRRRARLAVAS
jgi:hypothetical protein